MNREIQRRRRRIALSPREGDTLTFTEATPGCAHVWMVRVVRVTPRSVLGPTVRPSRIYTEAWGRSGLVFHGEWFVWQWRERVRRASSTREG